MTGPTKIEPAGSGLACPVCRHMFHVGGRDTPPEKTAFWGHYFSRKHDGQRPSTDEHRKHVAKIIRERQREFLTKRAQQSQRTEP